ncbi:hypothetical protein BO94DRAFT_571573 [Aspergillus sclerotioniger CBS 115572]|uniref:Uncharacterized protein n=1 Tax=Aspergillus sclerotioniger CBS 115572 TaxID=1450535 RepID=A0A317XDE0_9EURO|nr:hypothetical protein BO94DRAFT_571573 [Aspergillus sclerotioniger CBS 115572]PWY94918.1 hypothetical protein BO94DRAFT_571573 [Aspergillus sclerotioniger CBS 115572]
MVNWKLPEPTDRLIAALIAAHPALKIDYQTMVIYFGQGANYDTMHGRLRRCHILAEELQKETRERGGITDLPRARKSTTGTGFSTPRTPRGPRNGIQKASSSSSSRGKVFPRPLDLVTPTRSGPAARNGGSAIEAITIDDDFMELESTIRPAVKTDSRTVFPIVDTSSEDDIEIIDHPASFRIGKVEQPPQPSNTFFSYSGINNENGYGLKPERTESVLLDTTTNEADRAKTVAPIPPPSNLTTDPFNTSMGGFFVNSDYDIDDIYGGVA